MTNILAVALEAEFLARVNMIPDHRVVSIGRENASSVRAGAADQAFHPDLILVGTGIGTEKALEYARGVLEADPALSVVLVAEPSRALARAATRVGIKTVLPSTASDRDLATLLDRAGASAAKNSPPPTGPHQVIVVASPKGGVGKTTVAVNLAALLASTAPGEVVLLDLDLQFGDVSTILDLTPEHTVADALSSGSADSMLLRTLLVLHPANFYVLCGAPHPAETGQVHGDQIRKLVSQFATTFRYVVIDTSAGLYEETLASLEEATDVAFVATFDVATLRNVRKEIDVLTELHLLPERRHVILNRTDRMSGLTARDAASILGRPVDIMIPASAQVPLAANHGSLAVNGKKRNTVRQPLSQLARVIDNAPGSSDRSSHPRRSRRSKRSTRPERSSRPRASGRHV